MIGMVYDLVDNEAIYQGADWYKEFQLIDPSTGLPYDLTGYTVASQARKGANVITFTGTVAAAGTIRIALTNVQSSAAIKGQYKYDVELTEPAPSAIKHKAILPSLVIVVGEQTL